MNKKNNIIKSFRIESELKEKLIKAIEILNKNNYLNIKIPDYCRMSLNDFSNKIISGSTELKIK